MGRAGRIAAAAGLAAAIALAGLYGLFQLSRSRCQTLTGPVVCSVKTDARAVALTFDDGPTVEGVDAVLPVLGDRGVKATFFLVGRDLERRPGLAARLKADGHELANHGYSHVRMVGRPESFYAEQIARTDRLLRQEGEARPTLLRPPYGKRLWGFSRAAERAGYRVVTWDVEPDSAGLSDPSAYARHVLDAVRPGSIVLIHPMYRANGAAREALPLILDGLVERGYRVTTVSELLQLEQAR